MPRATSYLEIGVWKGTTLQGVLVPFKWGVDPTPAFRLDWLPEGVRFSKATSDKFFANLHTSISFDICFLDGLHTAEQTLRDFCNVMPHLNNSSVVSIDDVFPDDDLSAIPDESKALSAKREAGIFDGRWHGDVWKVVPAIAHFFPSLEMLVLGGEAPPDNPQALVFVPDGAVTVPSETQQQEFLGRLAAESFSSYKDRHPAHWVLHGEDSIDAFFRR